MLLLLSFSGLLGGRVERLHIRGGLAGQVLLHGFPTRLILVHHSPEGVVFLLQVRVFLFNANNLVNDVGVFLSDDLHIGGELDVISLQNLNLVL